MDGAGDHDVKQNQPNCENGTMKILLHVDSKGERCMKRRRDDVRRGQRQESKSDDEEVNTIKVPFRGVQTIVKQMYLYLYKICKYIEIPHI